MTATAIPVVLGLLVRRPSLGEAFMFLVMGMCVVLAVLATMWIGTMAMGACFSVMDKRTAAKADAAKAAEAEALRQAAATAATSPAPGATAAAGDDARVVAVIAAAAHVMLGSNSRIINIRPAQNDWSAEGRRQIFASHRVR